MTESFLNIAYTWSILWFLKFWNWCKLDQVVIVDDGSIDGTKRVGWEFSKKFSVDNVRVILLGRNHGKGEAIRKVSPF